MTSKVENLVLVELGVELVAEADYEERRISVRCIYDPHNWCWVYHVFLVEDGMLRRLSEFPSRLRASSRLGAVQMGMQFALNSIRGIPQMAAVIEHMYLPLTDPADDDG